MNIEKGLRCLSENWGGIYILASRPASTIMNAEITICSLLSARMGFKTRPSKEFGCGDTLRDAVIDALKREYGKVRETKARCFDEVEDLKSLENRLNSAIAACTPQGDGVA